MSKLWNFVSWIVFAPIAVGMALGPATPFVAAALGVVFVSGVALGAWIW